MVKGDTVLTFVLVGGAAFAGLYFFRQFCPGQSLGGVGEKYPSLCPTTDVVNQIRDTLDQGISTWTGGGDIITQPAKSTSTPTTGVRCTGGYAKVGNVCVCNTTYNKCPAGWGLYRTSTACQCGNCMTATCPAGSHSVVGVGGAGCNCVKNTTGGGGGTSSTCAGLTGSTLCNCLGAHGGCPSGTHGVTHAGGGCDCVSGSTVGSSVSGVQQTNAKLFIADSISRVIKACSGGGLISATAIVQGWSSNITWLAKNNNYNTTRIVQYNNRPWAKTYRDTVLAVAYAYKRNFSSVCTQQMSCLNSHSIQECGLSAGYAHSRRARITIS